MKFIQITKPEDAIEIAKKKQNESKIAERKLQQQQDAKICDYFRFLPIRGVCGCLFIEGKKREGEREE